MRPFRTVTACRVCGCRDLEQVVDLGRHPLANALQPTRELAVSLPRYPLQVMACPACSLRQLSVAVDKELLFGHDYAYQTPPSPELRAHYVQANEMIAEQLGLDDSSNPHAFVVEVGSNNGEFLKSMPWWAKTRLGVDPSINVGTLARRSGVETIVDFFCPAVARSIRKQFGLANVVVARHCLAHVDDVHDIISGVDQILSDHGVFYIENAYWYETATRTQLGQIYHEHMSYLTLRSIEELLDRHRMQVVDARVAQVHGGSLMVCAARQGVGRHSPGRVQLEHAHDLLATEKRLDRTCDSAFAFNITGVLQRLTQRLDPHWPKSAGDLYLYGASAKASTMLNAAGLTHERIAGAFDLSPIKQGKFMPGSGVEIFDTNLLHHIREPNKSTCILTSANYVNEILESQVDYLRAGGRFLDHSGGVA